MNPREYKNGDSTKVKDLILSILEKEYPFDREVYQDTDINDISGTYSGEGNAFFVVEEKDKIVGTVGIKKETNDTALVRRLFVGERHRKKGYGGSLLKQAIEFCRSKKYKEITFRATDRMEQAMNLCRKMGFREKETLEVSGFNIHKLVLKLG